MAAFYCPLCVALRSISRAAVATVGGLTSWALASSSTKSVQYVLTFTVLYSKQDVTMYREHVDYRHAPSRNRECCADVVVPRLWDCGDMMTRYYCFLQAVQVYVRLELRVARRAAHHRGRHLPLPREGDPELDLF